jgi:hypothetical protein
MTDPRKMNWLEFAVVIAIILGVLLFAWWMGGL